MNGVKFLPFKANDLRSLEVQARHEPVRNFVSKRPLLLADIEDSLWSFTMHADGKPRACVGATEEGAIWAFLAKDLRRWMLPLTRYGRSMIDAHVAVVGPLWAELDPEYPEAVKWARLAGFRQIDRSLWTYH